MIFYRLDIWCYVPTCMYVYRTHRNKMIDIKQEIYRFVKWNVLFFKITIKLCTESIAKTYFHVEKSCNESYKVICFCLRHTRPRCDEFPIELEQYNRT